MDIKENAASIKGLAEGLGVDSETKEGKVISALIELCEKMADRIVALEDDCAELREYIEEVDEDLGFVEDDLYLDEDERVDYDEEFENDFENDFEEEGSGFDELVCPSCGEIICVDENLEISDGVCPAGGEKLGDIELCNGECGSCEGCEEN